MSWVVGKIGYCNNEHLGIPFSGGHYVYIHSIDSDNKCTVSTITSLQNHDGSIKQERMFKLMKGYALSIPKLEDKSKLPLWSGINRNKISGVPVKFIHNIKDYIKSNYLDFYKSDEW